MAEQTTEPDYHVDEADFESSSAAVPDIPAETSLVAQNENGSIPHVEDAKEYDPGIEDHHEAHEDELAIKDKNIDSSIPDHQSETSQTSSTLVPKLIFAVASVAVVAVGGALTYQRLAPSTALIGGGSADNMTNSTTLSASVTPVVQSSDDTSLIDSITDRNILTPDSTIGSANIAQTDSPSASEQPVVTIAPVSSVTTLNELIPSRITLLSLKNPKYFVTADGQKYTINDAVTDRYEVLDIEANAIVFHDRESEAPDNSISLDIVGGND